MGTEEAALPRGGLTRGLLTPEQMEPQEREPLLEVVPLQPTQVMLETTGTITRPSRIPGIPMLLPTHTHFMFRAIAT